MGVVQQVQQAGWKTVPVAAVQAPHLHRVGRPNLRTLGHEVRPKEEQVHVLYHLPEFSRVEDRGVDEEWPPHPAKHIVICNGVDDGVGHPLGKRERFHTLA